MTAESILSAVKSTLENDTALKAYVRKVFLGALSENMREAFPNITIEPTSNETDRVLENGVRENVLEMEIAGAVLVQNKTLAVIGDATHVGVLDIERDIKAALFAKYPDLTKTCLYFTLSTGALAELESGNGRICFITAKFWYRES